MFTTCRMARSSTPGTCTARERNLPPHKAAKAVFASACGRLQSGPRYIGHTTDSRRKPRREVDLFPNLGTIHKERRIDNFYTLVVPATSRFQTKLDIFSIFILSTFSVSVIVIGTEQRCGGRLETVTPHRLTLK